MQHPTAVFAATEASAQAVTRGGLVLIIGILLALLTRADKGLGWKHTLALLIAGVLITSATGIGPKVGDVIDWIATTATNALG